MKGAGDKAFSAGGDIRYLIDIEKYGSSASALFRDIYNTISEKHKNKTPYIALMNGISMGGGAGKIMASEYRIATDRTIFAMPETVIGLFPDVGSSYFFNKLPGKLGLYMALTGTRLVGKDVLVSGIATHLTDSKNLQNIERDLLSLPDATGINEVLDKYCSQVDERELSFEKNLNQINELFTADSMESIVKNLKNDNSEFAQNTLKVNLFPL